MSKAKKLHTVTAPKTEQVGHKTAGLPELPGRHGDNLESVAFGPRREMILKINPLMWAGNRGYYGPAIAMRFGRIVNYAEVQETFKPRYCKEGALNAIEYDQEQYSKSVIVVIHCSSLTVTEAKPDTEKAA